jgi:hypothetical protein
MPFMILAREIRSVDHEPDMASQIADVSDVVATIFSQPAPHGKKLGWNLQASVFTVARSKCLAEHGFDAPLCARMV